MSEDFPDIPGEGLKEVARKDDIGNILIMYEMTGELDGDAWIAAREESLVRAKP